MNKYVYASGALTLLVGVLPAVALANPNNGEGGVDAQKQEMTERGNQLEATTSTRQNAWEQMNATSTVRKGILERIQVKLEDATTSVHSLEQLEQSVTERKRQLDQEAASTTSKYRDIVKDANAARLAVHTLLASKDLLGNIGGQVSQIAEKIDDSVATTTNIEAKIQSRSFLARLFFGGDATDADTISQQVAQNEQHIADLTKLLQGANLSADVQTTLLAQITALQDAQTRLQAVAQKEENQWGLFNWHLFK